MTSPHSLPLPHADQYDWQRHAACRTTGNTVFFGPDGHEQGKTRRQREDRAKQVCARCPVSSACLTHALRSGEPYGVWGGLTESERRRLLRSDLRSPALMNTTTR